MSGDFQLGDTIYIPFTTRAFATGVPTQLANTPVVTGSRDANTTQFTTGITLAVDFDSNTGLNMITVVATGANSYVSGETYTLYLTAGEVDSVSVIGEVVGHFTLEAAPVNWNRVAAPTTTLDLSATTIFLCDTTTANTDLVTAAAIQTEMEENGASKLDSILDELENGSDGLTALKTAIDAVPTVAEIQTEMEENAASSLDTIVDELANGSDGLTALKTAIDAIPTTAMRGTENAALASVCTEARLATCTDWIDGNRLDLLLDAVNTTTPPTVGQIQTEMEENSASLLDTIRDELANGTDGLTALAALINGLNDISTANVNTEVDNAIVTYGLDHLVQTSVTGTDIADNSIIAKLVDDAATADWDNYDPTTASLEALNVDTDAIKAETALIVTDTGTTLDSNITTIKTATDKLTFTIANQVDSNVQSINDVTIVGDGSTTPFNV